ncbi:MAG: hypothetical protein KAQ67_03140, partial [Gammaproteobacteria bacterium]|nr:hypothetical protein [Gammaproteobacteria bacterium]
MPTKAMERVLKRGKEAEKRIKESRALEAELRQPEPEVRLETRKETRVRNGMTSDKIVSLAEAEVYKNEQLGLFDAIPLADREV